VHHYFLIRAGPRANRRSEQPSLVPIAALCPLFAALCSLLPSSSRFVILVYCFMLFAFSARFLPHSAHFLLYFNLCCLLLVLRLPRPSARLFLISSFLVLLHLGTRASTPCCCTGTRPRAWRCSCEPVRGMLLCLFLYVWCCSHRCPLSAFFPPSFQPLLVHSTVSICILFALCSLLTLYMTLPPAFELLRNRSIPSSTHVSTTSNYFLPSLARFKSLSAHFCRL
jgi:hypothetical protein